MKGMALGAILLACTACMAQAATPALRSADGRFEVAPKRVASGGGRAAGGPYVLQATVGQHEAARRVGGGAFGATLGVRRAAQAPARVFGDGFED